GTLPEQISQAIQENDLAATAVLSGNRNIGGRINPDVKMNYLASPLLVISYALAWTMDFDFEADPHAEDSDGNELFIRDIWPMPDEIEKTIQESISSKEYQEKYADVFTGDERWANLKTPSGTTFEWDDKSTYVRKAPFFEGMTREPEAVT